MRGIDFTCFIAFILLNIITGIALLIVIKFIFDNLTNLIM